MEDPRNKKVKEGVKKIIDCIKNNPSKKEQIEVFIEALFIDPSFKEAKSNE